MKISHTWLQTWFEAELPDAATIGNALTFHSFEIDGIENDILDVKITPNRGHDCLSYRGIAKEVSAILQIPLAPQKSLTVLTEMNDVRVTIADSELCKRYIAGYIKGVKVGPSPQWLVERLASMGQRSVNNVVDATNFVMFNSGQPLHAFDAGQLKQVDGVFSIQVRSAREHERMVALDDKEYELSPSHLVIADAHADAAVGIAGIKGGKPASITEATHDIILESANFDGPSVRKTARSLALRTDASQRFEQVITPEFASLGMQEVVTLILDLAGGKYIGCTDVYPQPQHGRTVSVTTEHVNRLLGTSLSTQDIVDVFKRLQFSTWEGDGLSVVVPAERLDLTLPEDLIEEVGRIIGYDKVEEIELPPFAFPPDVTMSHVHREMIRSFLIEQGFSEVITSVFADAGERVVLNKVDGVRPYLRTALSVGLNAALEKNVHSKELLGLSQIKLFEIGTVWKNETEEILVDIAVEKVKKQKTEEEYRAALDAFVATLPTHVEKYPQPRGATTERYELFSKYPYIVRDIALWVDAASTEEEVQETIRHASGELLVRLDQFDRFEKEGRVSYAFRLVFQSFDRTLADQDAHQRMESIYHAVKAKGWEVR